jgi:hypothetical protein
MTEDQLRLISRIGKTQEGVDFVNEILKPMLSQNHIDLLREGKEFRDEMIGFGNCLANLVGLFENCDIRLQQQANKKAPDRF